VACNNYRGREAVESFQEDEMEATNRTMAATITSLGDFGLAKELKKLGPALPLPAPEVEEPLARVVPWLIGHYDPPRSLTEY
jgi:hypothetical protein